MVPPKPPLPTAWNLPFHAWAGSQTSILMSESDEGVSVAATRQKAGTWLKPGPPPARPPPDGGVNPPAGTFCAAVMVGWGSFSDDRLSHDAAAVIVRFIMSFNFLRS